MVVDDEKANLQLWTMLLSKEGFTVHAVEDGAEVLSLAQTDPPDLILLDIMMPHVTGYEVCEYLKSDLRTRDIPVIFLSALTDTVDKVHAFAVGAVDYIPKPFQVEEVLARLKTHLSLRQLQRNLEHKNEQLQREIVERQQAEQRLVTYAERLRTLHEIDQSILAARSPETIAIAAAGRIRRLIPCQRVVIIARAADNHLKTLAADSSGEVSLGASPDIYQELLENLTLHHGRPYGIQDLSQQPALSPMQAALYRAGIRAFIIIPLFMHNELLGTLHLESLYPGVFDADHVTAAAEVAILLAIAIRQVQLYDLAQQEITDRKLAEEALRRQTAELEARNQELDAYAHTVAHDLKSPLASLVGFSHLLQRRQASPEKTAEMLKFINESARRMTNIIDELLLLASVRKMEEIPLAPLEMQNVLGEVLKRLADIIDATHATLTLPDTWSLAWGYGPWVQEVWVNYLSNAIKYGGAHPQIVLGSEQLPDHHVRFWVRDHGPGIPPEKQAHLFSAFMRLDQAHVEGHGLGLSIVQRIIHKLNGEVGVHSAVGQGSEFFFTLPCSKA